MEAEQKLHIGMKAPNFTCTTTFGKLALSDFKGKWLVFFSHPGDFTPVCTTEFLAFASCYNKFKELDAELLALSIDSNSSHLAWIHNIYSNSNVVIPFPVIADLTGEIARLYNMKSDEDTSCVRSVYIIDPSGTVRVILSYPKEIGRNINEILRTLVALQISDNENVVTPANWEKGMPTIVKSPSTYEDLKERVLNSSDYNFFDWYLCFKKEMGE
ncbi:MAG: peroxiredoxin [Clostridia bacterium]|nr:peroxiredoxin [Clostridia bacterium]